MYLSKLHDNGKFSGKIFFKMNYILFPIKFYNWGKYIAFKYETKANQIIQIRIIYELNDRFFCVTSKVIMLKTIFSKWIILMILRKPLLQTNNSYCQESHDYIFSANNASCQIKDGITMLLLDTIKIYALSWKR